MQVLENVNLPKRIPNSKTAHGWDIAMTLALAQRVISLDSLVQLGPDTDSTDNGTIILNVSVQRVWKGMYLHPNVSLRLLRHGWLTFASSFNGRSKIYTYRRPPLGTSRINTTESYIFHP